MIGRPLRISGGIAALVLATLPMSRPAQAAPFCVQVSGIPDQCLYVDPAQCQREATRQGGRCGLNPAESVTPLSPVPYCLVMAGNQVSCLYPDRSHCDADAVRQGGACVAAIPPAPLAPAPAAGADPYALKRP